MTADHPQLAGPADIDALASTIGDAFVDDPMIRWPMPRATPADIRALFRIVMVVYVELGVVWKIGDCTGAAAWLPPMSTQMFSELEERTRPDINLLTDDAGVRYAEFWDWLGAHVPDEPCWFLDILGVRPEAQGRGVGRWLVEHGLRLAAAAGLPAFLETGNERNVTYYESFGFRIVDQQQAPGDGPTIWFMQTSATRVRP